MNARPRPGIRHCVLFGTAVAGSLLVLLGACTGPNDSVPDDRVAAAPSTRDRLVDSVAGDVELRELAEGVWIHTSYFTFPSGTRFGSNGLIVRDGDGLTLIDAAWGEVKSIVLLEMIESEIGFPVTRAVVTHSHIDRSAGIDLLRTLEVPIVAHPETRRRLLAEGFPAPDEATDALEPVGASLSVGNVEVVYPGPGHAPDNVMVWLEAHKILFGGCALRAADAPSLGNLADADVESWAKTIAWIRDRYPDVHIAVPGHGAEGDESLLATTASLLAAAVTNVRRPSGTE